MSEAKRILIAENDPRAGRELKFALEGRGYDVRLTASILRYLYRTAREGGIQLSGQQQLPLGGV